MGRFILINIFFSFGFGKFINNLNLILFFWNEIINFFNFKFFKNVLIVLKLFFILIVIFEY